MKEKRSFFWVIAIFCFCMLNSFAIGGTLPSEDTQPTVLHVNLDKVTFEDFMGVNAVYHGFGWMPTVKARGFNDIDRRRELDRIRRMELNIARTWYRADWAAGENTIAGPFDWDSPQMTAFYKWLDAMKKMNVDVALQAGWGFTKDTHIGRKLPDPDRDPAEYAAWVSESVHQIVNVRGFDNVKYLILMTEPTTSPWADKPKDGKRWPKYVLAKRGENETENLELWPYYVKVMRGLHEKMLKDGTRKLVKFVGPNNHGVGSFEQLRLAETVTELKDVIDIYGAHTYLPPENAYENWRSFMDQVQEAVAKAPKPVWLDEYNVLREWETHVRDQPAHGTYLAEVVAASLDAGVQTLMLWSLFDQLYLAPRSDTNGENSFYNGVHRWGTVKWPHDKLKDPTEPYPAWYAYSMLSKYLGGGKGTKVYQTKGKQGLRINALQQKNGTWSLLVINSTASEKKFSIKLSRKLGCEFERHVYDPVKVKPAEDAMIPGVDKVFEGVLDVLIDSLPAGAVAIYVSK
jgi:hypothetical protein